MNKLFTLGLALWCVGCFIPFEQYNDQSFSLHDLLGSYILLPLFVPLLPVLAYARRMYRIYNVTSVLLILLVCLALATRILFLCYEQKTGEIMLSKLFIQHYHFLYTEPAWVTLIISMLLIRRSLKALN